jgi:hypothetical protein
MRTIMRKRIVGLTSETVSRSSENWLDLERLAQVEITSESAEQPIECKVTVSAPRDA